MSSSIIHRGIAFCLSAMITLCMLGGIDQLAVPTDSAAGWAQQTVQQAPRG
jgi:hypothetical protein